MEEVIDAVGYASYGMSDVARENDGWWASAGRSMRSAVGRNATVTTAGEDAAGGALGQILKDSGTGTYVAELLAQTHIPIIILPFLMATLVRFVQGSGTVAMVTAAGICAPIIQAAGANMMLGAFAACVGSLFFSYFNDSYFWVVNNLMGFKDTKEQIRNWSVTSTIAWGVGFVELLILSIFMH